MSISVFELFKVGIGPSSSHTVGPMIAAARFARHLNSIQKAKVVARIHVELFGSLSATGKGHGTDKAIVMGLMGAEPDTVDPHSIRLVIARLKHTHGLAFLGQYNIQFVWSRDMQYLSESLPYHPNGMRLSAFDNQDELIYQNTYYSVGGGFIVDQQSADAESSSTPQISLPYAFHSAQTLLDLCETHQLSVSELMMENEKVWRSEQDVKANLLAIWCAMKSCVDQGLNAEGELPGGLHVKRRAKSLFQSLQQAAAPNVITSTLRAMDWVNLYALAVNEENAGGGRMVTAPTNGAAGIIPAVLMYYMEFTDKPSEDHVIDFLLVAGAMGVLCKENASISGAEVGCQGEVGSACAMAAAGLCHVLGGTPEQVENAAEIGLEHNLGLTCDPIGGLVQIPCIERNAIASMKAINAAQMALRGDGTHRVSLDDAINTMRETGADMKDKYKETSRGGLAVNVAEC